VKTLSNKKGIQNVADKIKTISITTSFKYQGIDISVSESKDMSVMATEQKILEIKNEMLNDNISFIKNFIDMEKA
jgi:hypothetical protein